MSTLPGSIWNNCGRWHWKVKLPGSDTRKNYPLRLPNQKVAMSCETNRDLAESIAWRIWEKAEAACGNTENNKNYETLNDVVAQFMLWAKSYYRRADGSPTSEVDRCSRAMRILRDKHGQKPIDDVGYIQVLEERNNLAHKVSRSTVNCYASVWKRFYAWALEHRKCSPNTKSEVWAISPLKKNRSSAKEGDQIKPVCHAVVKATVKGLPLTCKNMVLVQELCGARPGEMCIMRPIDIDQRRDVWIYRPADHKLKHRGIPRIVALGKRAQDLLMPLLDRRDVNDYVFSPMEAQSQRAKILRGQRKTKVQPSQTNRKKRDPEQQPGKVYDKDSYGQMVRRAAQAAGVGSWSPNRLRHACGTRVRRKFGVDAARAVLGHSNRTAGAVTDRYTLEAIEKEFVLAASKVMRKIG